MTLLELRSQLRLQHLQPGRQRPSWNERLEDGERRGERDTLLNERAYQRARHIAVGIDGGKGCLPGALTRALIRLLVRHKIGGREEAVLEVVDPERSRFTIGHRAEMPRDLEPTLVRLLDRRAKLAARDVHVRLERRRAGIGPEVHHASCVVDAGELVHLGQSESRTLEIGRGRVEPGARPPSGIDVAEAIHVPAGPHRRHAAGEIESREALGEVRVDAWPRGIEEVLVHHHEPRDHTLSREVHDLGASRYGDGT